MSTTRTRIFAFVLPLFVCGVSAVPAIAQTKPQTADDKELASYRLTMDGVNKMVRVNQAMAEELKKDPKYQESVKTEADIKALEAKDDLTPAEQKKLDDLRAREEQLEDQSPASGLLNDAKNLDEMAAKIKAFPPMANALAKEGVAPREYALFTMAILQAGMTAGLQKSGMLKQMPPGVNAENVKFVLDHEAELKKLQASFGPSDK